MPSCALCEHNGWLVGISCQRVEEVQGSRDVTRLNGFLDFHGFDLVGDGSRITLGESIIQGTVGKSLLGLHWCYIGDTQCHRML